MGKIFKQLARHWAACLAVVALLFVQAYCDLSLPDYTSRIVDTGIQQGGIESPLPETVRQSTLDALSLLMGEEDADALQNAYGYYLQDNGVLKLRSDLTDAERTALEEAVTTPDIVLYMAAAQNANATAGDEAEAMTATPAAEDLDAVCAQFAALAQMPGFSREMIQQQLASAMEQVDETTLSSMASQATLLVSLEYEAQGVSHDVQMAYLFRVGGQMLALTLLMVVVAVLVGLIASRVSASIGRELRRETFSSVIHFSNAEIENFSTASLITRTTNDIQQVQFTCVILLRMVAYAPILGIGGVMHVTQGNTGLAWIIVLDVAALLLLITVLMSVAMPRFKIMQTLVDKLNLVSREILTGVMPVRAFSRESFEEKRFDAASRELMGTQLFTNRAMVAMMPFMTLIMNGTSLLIVWFGGKAMDAGNMQVGEMIAFITYTMQIVMSFLMLAMVAVMLPRAGVAADRIDEVCRTKASIHDPDAATAKPALEKKDWDGVVRFEDVSFRFPGADSDALEHISFTANPGETTAIIGSTGCGKSSLLNLIPRFYDVTGGRVTIDGIDVREMPQEQLHSLLGYVPQKGILFSGTIESNLKFGGAQITDAGMKKAASIAQATEFIDAKPEGYASPIAQGGSNVSGGQKQRLSIARAIAKDPKIYLFDDSFSALDYKTDVTLRRALKEETDNATVIIVAQRISTVLHANQILVLDDGRLVGKGTHAQLMATCPEYQEIARSQLSQKELNLQDLNTGKEDE
ncbi:ABC transporter ATP-binding protein/permease [Faecalibacterium sp. CLA-AA-H254]|uniref:ABC transporter ATP-binding protein n=1 Tax=Faecalibacterium hominis (ex Afrizal et al. 2022) TaxID=2881265 RepID=UPI001D0F4874|nr:ABC transporter ATP-binding protein [Faecalibacterium hominis (ex Afrizal et al. 2022)]MCC2121871.1 ABC transporter ATP-binding protein/permease [Faecalibacterium hominis (ex Afrizal et al. 2022)]